MHTTGSVLTVGDLSRRTGIPIKAIRHYTDQGLVYTLGRSSAGYRTYNHDALRCLELITTLRGLGLTLAEIGELARTQPRAVAPTLAWLLTASKQRVQARIAALQATLDRIDRFQRDHHTELAGRQPLWADDAECGVCKRLTLTPGSDHTVGDVREANPRSARTESHDR